MDDTAQVRVRRHGWLIFSVLACGYGLTYFHRQCASVVAVDLMAALGAGGTSTGFLGAAYFYPYALVQLPAGLLADSWGPRRTITLFFGLAGLGSVLLGVASNVPVAFIGRSLVGVGVGMLFVPTMKVLSEWFRPRDFPVMMGILLAVGGLGFLSATRPLAQLNTAIGWRYSFIGVAGATVIVTVLVWLLVRDRPRDRGLPSPREDSPGTSPAIGLRDGFMRVVSCARFWPLAVWFFFDCGVFFSFIALWGGPYLQHVYGLSRIEAGNILALGGVGLVVGSPLLGLLSNHVLHARKPVIVLSSLVVVVLTAVLAFFPGELPLCGIAALCLGLGIFGNAVVVIGFTAAKELFPVAIAGTATGLVNFFPFAGAAVLQPIMGAAIAHHGKTADAFTAEGYRAGFLVLFICAVIACAASFLIKETFSAAEPRTEAPGTGS